MTTFLPKNQNVQKISAALGFHKRGKKKKNSDICYNKHYQSEEELKKTIMLLM